MAPRGDSSEAAAPHYGERLEALVAGLRKDLDAPDVPFVAAGLGDFFVARQEKGGKSGARAVNQTLAALPGRIKNFAFVSAAGLKDKGDGTHFDAPSARDLGRRFAEALVKLPPAPASPPVR